MNSNLQVKQNFSSKEARQIVSLVAFFLGRTPFDTMAIYTLLSYTEFQHDGYYNVEGGMYKIVEGMYNLAKELGVSVSTISRALKNSPQIGKEMCTSYSLS